MTDATGPRIFTLPSSALATCPKFSWSPAHWDHYEQDGRCNCGRICGFSDTDGGPCILLVDDHAHRANGQLVHDDGRRTPASAWRR